ncbi:MAG TPA: sugar-transfer associated ATP-grasp domain-containing protein [Bacilli bacterium]|jgi:glutathione synthase/RimK-type ligase-like ATP-grasp enzyme|nr:sugar-transfer associated ATP-grasp domain-containing protein [Bacilli bacterium]
MGKVKYMIARIAKMDYGNMFKTIDKVASINHKNKVGIFFDVVSCGLKYGAGYIDYYQFQMYKMNKDERKTIITRGINNSIMKKYNDPSAINKFEDKALFNKLFNKYLNRDWIYLNDASVEEFAKFLEGKEFVIVKPLDLSCGKGVEKLRVVNKNPEELYKQLKASSQTLVEEVAKQNKVINDIYPNSVNTLRVVTLNSIVVTAYLRIGNHGNVVDNFNHGGMVTAIDVDTGMINYPAIDKETNVYEVHPMTGKKIVGVQIPMWDDVKKLCVEACDVVPEVGYIAWDVCLGENKPCLIEGNDFPGHDLYQLPVHRTGNCGLLPRFEKAMKEGKI